MKDNTLIKSTTIGSIILAILHSILFWDKRIGISAIIFSFLVVVFFIYVLGKNRKIKNSKAQILCIPIVLLSLTYFVFNNELFRFLNFFVITGLIILMTIFLTTDKIRFKFLITKVIKVVFGPLEFFGEVFEITKTAFKGKKEEEENKSYIVKKIAKSILISLPVVLIVFFLLISADSVFANMFSGVTEYFEKLFIQTEVVPLAGRIVLIIIIFVYFTSYMLNLTEENTMYTKLSEDKTDRRFNIEGLTVNITLTILNSIYLIFSIIQFVYLFTKAGVGESFNYAEYARQGFFQLMFVSFINFAMIFISSVNKKEMSKNQSKYTKLMNIFLAVFTIILIISSIYRMYLYEQEHGYTYLRLLVYFTLFTELIILIPTIIYVKNKKIDIFKYVMMIGITMYVILNYINIDYVIAKRNIDKYFENQSENKIDFNYLKYNTGTDAISEITRLLESEDEALVNDVNIYLSAEKYRINLQERKWQEVNLSEVRAEKALVDIKAEDRYSNDLDDIQDNATHKWKFTKDINGFYVGNINTTRPIYGLEFRLVYNESTEEFEYMPQMGDLDKIKYITITDEKITIAVYSDYEIIYNFYGIQFNRDEVTTIPENWCSNYDTGAKITNNGEVNLIELPFNRLYGKGEIRNIDVSFGKVD